ncbi:MAG: hypothetical protein ABI615_04040 [Chthoniobacterales bacterium]
MTLRQIIFCVLTLCFCVSADASENFVITDAKPQEGVFFCSTDYVMTVLELKDGNFRYWSKLCVNKGTAALQTGTYSVKGDSITLSPQVFERHWTFRTVNGELTLWWTKAIRTYETNEELRGKLQRDFEAFKKHGASYILIPTDKSAESIWKPRGIVNWLKAKGFPALRSLFKKSAANKES